MPASADQNSTVVLCAASNNDLEDLVAIRLEAMRESLERLGRFNPGRARERFLGGFDANSTRRIEVSGNLVGFVVIKDLQGELLLDHLYVIPRAQGAGIGSEVLLRFSERLMRSGVPSRLVLSRKALQIGFTLAMASYSSKAVSSIIIMSGLTVISLIWATRQILIRCPVRGCTIRWASTCVAAVR